MQGLDHLAVPFEWMAGGVPRARGCCQRNRVLVACTRRGRSRPIRQKLFGTWGDALDNSTQRDGHLLCTGTFSHLPGEGPFRTFQPSVWDEPRMSDTEARSDQPSNASLV